VVKLLLSGLPVMGVVRNEMWNMLVYGRVDVDKAHNAT
jgi:hypothetical protein